MNETLRSILILLAAIAFLVTLFAMRKARARWADAKSRGKRERATYILSVALLITVIALLWGFRGCGVF